MDKDELKKAIDALTKRRIMAVIITFFVVLIGMTPMLLFRIHNFPKSIELIIVLASIALINILIKFPIHFLLKIYKKKHEEENKLIKKLYELANSYETKNNSYLNGIEL